MASRTSVRGKGSVAYQTRKGITVRRESDRKYTGPGTKPKGTKAFTPPVTVESTVASGAAQAKARRRSRRRSAARKRRRQALALTKGSGRQKAAKPKAPKTYKAPGLSRTTKTKSIRTKPETFQGRKTAGTPSLRELSKAQKTGKLKVNKKGYVVTPKVGRAGKKLRRAQKKVRKSRSRADLPYLTKAQERNARTVLRQGEKAGATRKEKLAAVETGLVEAPNFANPAGGHLDSEGWRQERTSIYGTGPKGPTNVKASARRFFDEVRTDPGTSTAPTPGLLAQAAQGSAFPERYDERAPEAKQILRAYNKGKPSPKARRRLEAAKAEAAKVGLRAGKPKKSGKPRKTPTIVKLGKTAIRKFGLTVGEHPAFGGVAPGVHNPEGFHPTGEAIDVTGEASKLSAFNRWVAKKFGGTVAEMFYDPGISLDNGVPVAPIGGHGSHVHVAIDEPGTAAYGLVAQAQGLPASGQPFGYYGAGSSAKAARASARRARQAALTPTQKAHRTLRKLERLGAGVGSEAGPTSRSSTTTLRELESRYM